MSRRNSQCRFTIEEEKRIIKEYQEGSSMAKLGKKHSCDPTTISNILKAYKIPARNLSEARRNFLNYTIKEDIFENIDTPDKAYWLGVLYSDGYISKAGQYTNIFAISVSEKDKEWLESFKKFLGYSGNIHHYKATHGYKIGAPYVRLAIGNNKMVEDLIKLGVVEQKTQKIHKLPNIPFLDDFIRGYIDGDGSLLKVRPHFQISGNYPFLLAVAEYFDIPYNIRQDKSIYCLNYKKRESEYLEKRLYKNANFYLQRKYNIAKRSFDSPLTLENVKEKL